MKKTTGVWFIWITGIVLLAVCIKVFGKFATNISEQGPLGWILGILSFLFILLLVLGIEQVRGSPKEFGHYLLFGKLTGISVEPGFYPTLGNILSLIHFPGDQEIIDIPVSVTCASAKGPGKGPDVTIEFRLEGRLDPDNVAEIVALGSTGTSDSEAFREELKKFVASKFIEHAKNTILSRTLDVLNADRFDLVFAIAREMWNGTPPRDANAFKLVMQKGTKDVIQGFITNAIRVNSVSEPGDIKAQRTKTAVKIAELETAEAALEVARVQEDQNKMEAKRYAEILRDLLAQGVPKEQAAVIAASIADKMKTTGTINVVSSGPNTQGAGASGIAQAAVLGAAIASNNQGQGGVP